MGLNMAEAKNRRRRACRLYCDGGVIGRNPSPHGGTWAFYYLIGGNDDDPTFLKQSSLVTPDMAGLPMITNNYTELLAAVCGMEVLPGGWDGTIYTDSHVTLCRLVNPGAGMKGIPDDLQARLAACKARLGDFRCVLLDGHPTTAQLAAGKGKRGNPVSKWNVLCDKECTRIAKEYWAGWNEASERGGVAG